ncbi:MAG: putative hydroxypyruvate isomerase [Actinomycetota bacterium]|jgi:hydroxypyruvate isomerase
MQSEFQLAVCAEMVFTDLPFMDRVQKIQNAGFDVEIWDWSNKDLAALRASGANIKSMTGYLRGDFFDGADQLLATAAESIVAAKQLGSPRLNLHGTGLGEGGIPVKPVEVVTGKMWLQAYKTLTRLVELAKENDVVFCLENLNLAVDHAGTPFARAEDTLTLVSEINSPHLRLNLDLYHAQIGEGNLLQLIDKCFPYIGEIQVADVPGRCEPGTGEINYPMIAKHLAKLGYTGTIAMEAFAESNSELALERFRNAFTI